jgi:hypothetical protein
MPPVTPTTSPLSHPFSLRRPSHSRSSSPTRLSSSLARISRACSRSFFLRRNRALAAVFRRLLSSDAESPEFPGGEASSAPIGVSGTVGEDTVVGVTGTVVVVASELFLDRARFVAGWTSGAATLGG